MIDDRMFFISGPVLGGDADAGEGCARLLGGFIGSFYGTPTISLDGGDSTTAIGPAEVRNMVAAIVRLRCAHDNLKATLARRAARKNAAKWLRALVPTPKAAVAC